MLASERENRKWGQATDLKAHSLCCMTSSKSPPPKGSITVPTTASKCGPSVKMHEPMGDISHSNYSTKRALKSLSWTLMNVKFSSRRRCLVTLEVLASFSSFCMEAWMPLVPPHTSSFPLPTSSESQQESNPGKAVKSMRTVTPLRCFLGYQTAL